MAHFGSWSEPTYTKHIHAELDEISDLWKIFGDSFVAPLQLGELLNYNSDPKKVELGGYIHFLDYLQGIKLAYNHEQQQLKFSFGYTAYKWTSTKIADLDWKW